MVLISFSWWAAGGRVGRLRMWHKAQLPGPREVERWGGELSACSSPSHTRFTPPILPMNQEHEVGLFCSSQLVSKLDKVDLFIPSFKELLVY